MLGKLGDMVGRVLSKPNSAVSSSALKVNRGSQHSVEWLRFTPLDMPLQHIGRRRFCQMHFCQMRRAPELKFHSDVGFSHIVELTLGHASAKELGI